MFKVCYFSLSCTLFLPFFWLTFTSMFCTINFPFLSNMTFSSKFSPRVSSLYFYLLRMITHWFCIFSVWLFCLYLAHNTFPSLIEFCFFSSPFDFQVNIYLVVFTISICFLSWNLAFWSFFFQNSSRLSP